MNITRTALILLTLLPTFGFCQNLDSQVDKIYQVKDNAPGISILISKGEKILLEKQYGISNLDYDIPITNKTVFDIGSIAKQFTAYAILLLEKQGKISIKEPAYKYIYNLPRYQKGNPTIEQLLNQTSGIKEVDGIAGMADLTKNDLLTQSQMINFITKITSLNFKPGEYFQYTNSNYILLADIITKVSGKPFAEFMQEDVFEPFGMENTIKKSSSYTIIKNRAIGYIEDEGDFYKTHLHAFIYNGDGQVLTTPKDIFKWHLGLQKVKIQHPELYKKMHTKAKLNNGNIIDYGLGVEFETHNNYQAFGFDGMILGGFVSKYLYFPDLDMMFFTTQNTFDSDFEEQFFQLVDLYIPNNNFNNQAKNNEREKKVKLSKKQLKLYEGSYLFTGSDVESIKINTIQLKNDELTVFTTDGDEITKLKPIGNHQFMFNDKLVIFDLKYDRKSYKYYDSENELPWLFKEYNPTTYNEKQLKEFEGQYFNADFQISKKVKLLDGILFVFGRNGAWKNDIEPLYKDAFNYSSDLLTFTRDNNEKIIGLKIKGIVFEKV
ncbi:serine hydrolase domain-containing protein [Meridianimaribacter flavus]|uniref:CubicO group peptidase (Beta-lactamase class C family) n=1 Tax=Meridianimaribacter flavus TaxID=571115 RepID=A0ABY2G1A9_9FLAO|nr:serine hydrolase domain-containing protein [Meridianimaribacter flavus]TDY05775.1 CubicO group peptidase (beta-lactamase class C family) [Meridianimaribacter flavus]